MIFLFRVILNEKISFLFQGICIHYIQKIRPSGCFFTTHITFNLLAGTNPDQIYAIKQYTEIESLKIYRARRFAPITYPCFRRTQPA